VKERGREPHKRRRALEEPEAGIESIALALDGKFVTLSSVSGPLSRLRERVRERADLARGEACLPCLAIVE
jgi:hypothetical protein